MIGNYQMWLFGWILVKDESNNDDDSDIDTDLLFEVGEQWLQDASQGGDEAAVKWQAVEHIEEETGGGFWHWLTGR